MKTARTLWAGFWLACGVALAAVLLPAFLLSFGVVLGVPSALKGGAYWQRAWIGFDKWCNVMLGGLLSETISSRLGKSKLYGCRPVFGLRWIDGLVSWWLHQIDHNHVENSVNLSVGCDCLSEDFGHNGS